MNKNKLWVASVITCAFFKVHAQVVEKTNNDTENVNIYSNRKFKNEAGLDISPFKFILGNYSAGFASLFCGMRIDINPIFVVNIGYYF